MNTAYYVLFIVLSVVAADEDNFFKKDETRKLLDEGDAPYVVTIRKQEEYICNGVVLAENLVLTASVCILQDFDDYSVVYGTTIFDSKIPPDEKKQVSALIFLNDTVSSSEKKRHEKHVRLNKYKNNGNDSESNDDKDEDVHKGEDDEDEDYAENRKSYLSKIVVVKVDSPFDLGENVHNIMLPFENESLPSNEGTIVFRDYGNNRSKQSLQSQKLTLDSQEIDYIDMYSKSISEDDKDLLQGSPFVINNTLYGLIVVEDYDDEEDDYDYNYDYDYDYDDDDPEENDMIIINIPRVIREIRDIITKNN